MDRPQLDCDWPRQTRDRSLTSPSRRPRRPLPHIAATKQERPKWKSRAAVLTGTRPSDHHRTS